jgi:hypothetical protein
MGKISEKKGSKKWKKKDWEKHGIYKLQDCIEDE